MCRQNVTSMDEARSTFVTLSGTRRRAACGSVGRATRTACVNDRVQDHAECELPLSGLTVACGRCRHGHEESTFCATSAGTRGKNEGRRGLEAAMPAIYVTENDSDSSP